MLHQVISKPASTDPVVALGEEAGRLWDRYEELDEACTAKGKTAREQTHADISKEHVWDTIMATQDYAASMQAQSIPGALVHAAILAAVIDMLDACNLEESEQRELRRKAKRLIDSIGGVLRGNVGGIDPLSKVHFSNSLAAVASK